MPKVNVYLPDALAERVREAELPVSAICQAALSDALDAAAAAADGVVAPGDLALPPGLDVAFPLGQHVATVLALAGPAAAARGAAEIGAEDVLQALLDEGESLVLRTIERVGVPRQVLQAELASRVEVGDPLPEGAAPLASPGARAVVERAVAEAGEAGSPMVTGGHLVLALEADDGVAGATLHALGIDGVLTRRIIGLLSSGVAYGRATQARRPVGLAATLEEVRERLERIERRLDGPPPV